VQDRDLNAARNIRAEGLKLLAVGHTDNSNARRAAVRPATCRHAALKRESHALRRVMHIS
jgi:transposase